MLKNDVITHGVRVNSMSLQARYNAIGAKRGYFAVAAIAVLLGALLPLVQQPLAVFLGAGGAMHFFNLGTPGVLALCILLALSGLPVIRPNASRGIIAIPLLATAAVMLGMMIALFAVASYGLFGVGLGLYAWTVAAIALTVAYSARIIENG